MTISEILLLDYDSEIANTRRTLELIPEGNPQWKPHEKSMPIGRLAVHVSRLPHFCTRILTTSEVNLATEKFPPMVFESTAALLSELESSAAEARGQLASASDDHMREHWKLLFGDKVFADDQRATLYRVMFFNHLIHHRAQLGVYLRLLNIPIPGLYGPSADDPMM